MSADDHQTEWEVSAFIALIAFVACPLGLATAIPGFIWATRRPHERANLAVLGIVLGGVAAVILAVGGASYGACWSLCLTDFVRMTGATNAIKAILGMLPVSIPAGASVGILGAVARQWMAERHPIAGRLATLRRLDALRDSRIELVGVPERVPLTTNDDRPLCVNLDLDSS